MELEIAEIIMHSVPEKNAFFLRSEAYAFYKVLQYPKCVKFQILIKMVSFPYDEDRGFIKCPFRHLSKL